MERFGFQVEAVALDSGYLSMPICHALEQKGIFAVIGYRRFHPTQGLLPKWKFKFDAKTNSYICPANHRLTYRTTNREGYREYKSNPEICRSCSLLKQCTRSRSQQKIVVRHMWEDSRERVRENRLTKSGKHLYRKRKETIERSFADAKQLHGYRYARFRGRRKVLEQALMTAACQNMKKIALHLDRQSS